MLTIPTLGAALALVSLLPGHRPQPRPVVRPAYIILIRHADKPADPANPHLSPAGVERAKALARFVGTDPAMTVLGRPAAVFATHVTKDDDGQRTQETVAPLAASLGVSVRAPELGKNYAALAREILDDPAFAGKTIVICWNHEFIPQLAAALGVTPEPPKWKNSVYDLVYVIAYHGRKATLTTSRYEAR